MNGQRCMGVGHGGVAPVQFTGASLCCRRSVTFKVVINVVKPSLINKQTFNKRAVEGQLVPRLRGF